MKNLSKERNKNLTNFTKALCNNIDEWTKLQPQKLNSITLLILGGMIRTSNNRIIKGKLNIGQIFECCGKTAESNNLKYVTLHKIFECEQKNERLELLINQLKNSYSKDNMNLRQIMAKTISNQRKIKQTIEILKTAAGFAECQGDSP